jgi:hypothetical protein
MDQYPHVLAIHSLLQAHFLLVALLQKTSFSSLQSPSASSPTIWSSKGDRRKVIVTTLHQNTAGFGNGKRPVLQLETYPIV